MKSRIKCVVGMAVAAIAVMGAITPSLGVRAAGSDVAYAFRTIDAPNGTNTYVMANNASGDVVGYYTDASKVYHGFLLRGGAFTTLDFPGGDVAWTQVEAINDAVQAARAATENSIERARTSFARLMKDLGQAMLQQAELLEQAEQPTHPSPKTPPKR